VQALQLFNTMQCAVLCHESLCLVYLSVITINYYNSIILTFLFSSVVVPTENCPYIQIITIVMTPLSLSSLQLDDQETSNMNAHYHVHKNHSFAPILHQFTASQPISRIMEHLTITK
jgi:hypothetical protein